MENTPNQQSLEKSGVGDFESTAQIGTPTGEADISTLSEGSPILAYSAKFESGKIILTATDAKVELVNSLPINNNIYKCLIALENKNTFMCTYNQPFLLSDGTYASVVSLQQGQCLVDKDGNALEVMFVANGYQDTIYSIATDMPGSGPDGHLILYQGVIAGDIMYENIFVS